MSKMVNCKACGIEIAKGTKCVHCGKDQRNFFGRHKILTGLGIIILIAVISNSGKEPTLVEPTTSTIAVADKVVANPVKKVVPPVAKKVEVAKPVIEEKTEENVPAEYKSALEKAKTYSDIMSMSKVGVYDQLTSEYGEKFSKEAAKYAIDNVKADWKENALKKAHTYQKDMSMSPSAIYDQLISEYGEKFTAKEAQYAKDNLK